MGHTNPVLAIGGVIAIITFLIIVSYVIPHIYNQNLKSNNIHTNYCSSLYTAIQQDKQIPEKQNITINELNLYSQNCSN